MSSIQLEPRKIADQAREATTPNRSIVLLKFRDPLQAADFLVIFTGRPFSTLDARETCHPIRIHHLVLHHVESPTTSPTAIPAFPPSTYSSRAKALASLLKGVPTETIYELPSCPVCLERLDSSVTGLVTLPCAHTFDCDCLRKWGDSRCPVCRVSHLLLSSSYPSRDSASEITRLTTCATCGLTSGNWICVVCGVVGCGRYEPGKAHARRHWEESGHVLAMELDTQRVWDYKGDKCVIPCSHNGRPLMTATCIDLYKLEQMENSSSYHLHHRLSLPPSPVRYPYLITPHPNDLRLRRKPLLLLQRLALYTDTIQVPDRLAMMSRRCLQSKRSPWNTLTYSRHSSRPCDSTMRTRHWLNHRD